DRPLAPGCLARLDEIAVMFELRIVEVTAHKRDRTAGDAADAVPQPNLASGSAPSPAFEDEVPTNANAKIDPQPPLQAVDADPPVMLAASDLEVVALADDAAGAGESFEEPTQTAVPRQLAATPEVSLP